MSRTLKYSSELREVVGIYIREHGNPESIIEYDLELWLLDRGYSLTVCSTKSIRYLMRHFKMYRQVIGETVVWFHQSVPVDKRTTIPT